MEINIFIQYLATLCIILTSAGIIESKTISDKRLCFDPKCSEPVSLAKTLMAYHPNHPGMIGFKANVDVTVFSKSAGNRTDLWGVEIDGLRGYVPKKMIREYKVLHSKLQHEVPTEPFEKFTKEKHQSSNTSEENINSEVEVTKTTETSPEKVVLDPNKVTTSSSFEVVDGTTIYDSNEESPAEITENVPKDVQLKEEEEQQPVLSVHPSLMTSTLNFVSSYMFDSGYKATETLDDNKDDDEDEITEEKEEQPIVDDQEEENIEKDEESLDENNKEDVKDETNEVKEEANQKQETKDQVSGTKSGDKELTINETDTLPTQTEVESTDKESAATDVTEDKVPIVEEKREKSSIVEETLEKFLTIAAGKAENPTDDVKINVEKEERKTDTVTEEQKSLTEESVINESESTVLKSKAIVEETIPVVEESNMNKSVEELKSVTEELKPFVEEPKLVAEELKPFAEESKSVAEELKPFVEESKQMVEELKPIVEESKAIVEDSKLVTEEPKLSFEEPTAALDSEKMVYEEQIKFADNFTLDIPSSKEEVHDKIQMTEGSNKIESAIPYANAPQQTFNKNVHNALETEFKNEMTQSSKIEEQVVSENLSADDNTINKVITSEDNTTIDQETLQNVEINSSEKSLDDSLITENVVTESTIEKAHGISSDQLTTEIPQSIDQTDQINLASEYNWTVMNLLNNRNLLNVNDRIRYNIDESSKEVPLVSEIIKNKDEELAITENITNDQLSTDESDTTMDNVDTIADNASSSLEAEALSSAEGVCEKDLPCPLNKIHEEHEENDFLEDSVMDETKKIGDYWESIIYVGITAFTTLLFSLGYYYIENSRRDSLLIARINKLERELMVSTKECKMLDENLQSTATKLNSIENESCDSNEMAVSLIKELESCKKNKAELEEQVATLEKELESASEAGLELERMLREVLSSHSDDNPLVKSIEDLQTRLNAQQAANESLTNALNLKVQENESLSSNLADATRKCEILEKEVNELREEIQTQSNLKIYMEQNLTDQIQRVELQFKAVLEEKTKLRGELKEQEQKVKELSEVIEQYNANNLDFEKLFEVAHVKAEVVKLTEERDDLKIKLSEVEGAHQLLEEHVKIVDEQIATFSEQCRLAEKEKKEAETRLEVLSNFFKEKEAQRQKEEALWLQKQGEVSSTVERIQTMQNEIQNYKQQVEMLKREIIEQEKEYKSQIAVLETKSHEQWLLARQNERRLEEAKNEASQLRNRLTMVEKNLDADPEAKLHRLEANGESATSPALFLGAESSSSPIMFAGSGGLGLPPPPPNFMFGAFLPPPLPPPQNPPYEVGQRLPPLGARLASPPPHPPPMSPPLPSPYGRHRSPPPPLPSPYASELHQPLRPSPLLLPSMLPMPLESLNPRPEESLPHIRNSDYNAGAREHQREQRTRNHKGSLNSSGESLDKSHHIGKV